ncbi:hypothetical protein MIR68_002307 [Amoeboaphelidium protococcarum]|nr:hypothetical protein MIR68_002307 [Amoeboaphelidium protococcarum]
MFGNFAETSANSNIMLVQREMFDRNSAMTCPSKRFDQIRKMNQDIILKDSTTKQKQSQSKSASERDATAAANTQEITKKSTGLSKKKGMPVILLPNSTTCLISLDNCKKLLEDFQFVSPLLQTQSTAGRNQDSQVIIKHNDIQFLVTDDAQYVKDNNLWPCVVAVFTTGQSWQFKDYLYKDPTSLFSNVQGFHLKYADPSLNAQVKNDVYQWNVHIMEISRHKRHLDSTCVLRFWNILDQFIRTKKPELVQQ